MAMKHGMLAYFSMQCKARSYLQWMRIWLSYYKAILAANRTSVQQAECSQLHRRHTRSCIRTAELLPGIVDKLLQR